MNGGLGVPEGNHQLNCVLNVRLQTRKKAYSTNTWTSTMTRGAFNPPRSMHAKPGIAQPANNLGATEGGGASETPNLLLSNDFFRSYIP